MSQDKKADATTEKEEVTTQEESPRPKTPLERIREGQAKMRNNASQSGGGKGGGVGGASTGAHQRRQFNRKAG